MDFGKRVRELRKTQGLSQRELAAQSGIDFTYLSKIENARMEPPSEKVILKVAEALDTDPDELTLLAGKIPSDIRDRVDVGIIKMLRRQANTRESVVLKDHDLDAITDRASMLARLQGYPHDAAVDYYMLLERDVPNLVQEIRAGRNIHEELSRRESGV